MLFRSIKIMRYKIVRFQKFVWRNMMRSTKSKKTSVLYYSIDDIVFSKKTVNARSPDRPKMSIASRVPVHKAQPDVQHQHYPPIISHCIEKEQTSISYIIHTTFSSFLWLMSDGYLLLSSL